MICVKTLQKMLKQGSDFDLKDFINLYKKCTAKPYPFLVINATLASVNLSRFRKNPLEGI